MKQRCGEVYDDSADDQYIDTMEVAGCGELFAKDGRGLKLMFLRCQSRRPSLRAGVHGG
jgi:hypothetical protein